MGATIGQRLRAIADEAEKDDREVDRLQTMLMEMAGDHADGCRCQACNFATRFPEWLVRLRKLRT